MEIEDKLLKIAREQPNTTDGFCNMILYGSLALVIANSSTSPNGDFSNEKEHNISLKESSSEDSQISSNDETSLNNNIMFNKLKKPHKRWGGGDYKVPNL